MESANRKNETKYFEVQSGDISFSTCLHKKYTKLPLKVVHYGREFLGRSITYSALFFFLAENFVRKTKHLLIIDRECYSLFEEKKNFSGKARPSKLLIIKEFIINNYIKYNINNIIVLSKQVYKRVKMGFDGEYRGYTPLLQTESFRSRANK
ncbi:hypothetical protein C1646_668695 [Rhizophagus diaphanus]|nr:hypothetical protein C1646_668695 [Rhizophagus diaphanus] [Rhizophagus sp. MUCL 43196]